MPLLVNMTTIFILSERSLWFWRLKVYSCMQLAIWLRDYAEAAYNSLYAAHEACAAPEVRAHFAALVSRADLLTKLPPQQRRLYSFVKRSV